MGIARKKLGSWWAIYVEYELHKRVEKLWMWIAWHLPKVLVKWASVRLMSHATVGEYSNQVVPELTAIDALKRWEDHETRQQG